MAILGRRQKVFPTFVVAGAVSLHSVATVLSSAMLTGAYVMSTLATSSLLEEATVAAIGFRYCEHSAFFQRSQRSQCAAQMGATGGCHDDSDNLCCIRCCPYLGEIEGVVEWPLVPSFGETVARPFPGMRSVSPSFVAFLSSCNLVWVVALS